MSKKKDRKIKRLRRLPIWPTVVSLIIIELVTASCFFTSFRKEQFKKKNTKATILRTKKTRIPARFAVGSNKNRNGIYANRTRRDLKKNNATSN